MNNQTARSQTYRDFYATCARVIVLAALFVAGTCHAAFAQVAPTLGDAESFAVLGASAVTNTGPTEITGDLGVSPDMAITGFPPGLVLGTTHAADALALDAQGATTTIYNDLAGQACSAVFGMPADIGGLTLVPGVYCFSSSAQITGALTLDAGGDPGAVWIFKIGSTLVTASDASVLLVNGAQQCNVFWQVGSSATIGTDTTFVGNIVALTSITLQTRATVAGRALARNGAVTMDSNIVSIAACEGVPVTPLPPLLGKAFSPATVAPGGLSTLTITLSNPDVTASSLTAPLVDTLPPGLLIAGSASTTCVGIVSEGASSVTLTDGSIPANGSCTVTVPVSAANGGAYLNSLGIGALQTTNGYNPAPAIATLTVPQPPSAPSLSKAFEPATIVAGGVSTLTITLANPDTTDATLTSPFTDTLPSGVVTASPGATTCGGVVSISSSTVTLTGGTIPANGFCVVTVQVTASAGGNFLNNLAIGALQTSNGNNAAPAMATLTVQSPMVVQPTLGKAFAPASINAGGSSTLVITLSNASAAIATLTAPLTDTLPTGLVTSGGAITTCGGDATVTASTVTQTGGSIPANGSCTVTVDVTAAAGGVYTNTLAAGVLQTSNGNNAAPAIVTLTVLPLSSVTLGKSFSPATVATGVNSMLTITLSNTGATPATLTAPLSDTLPSGLLASGGATTTCGGVATVAGQVVTLSGGSIPANGSCTVKVAVAASSPGNYINTLAAGALQTSNGSNAAVIVATLTVVPATVAPTLNKTFTPATINAGGMSTLTITLTNAGSTAANLTATLTDYLPNGVVVSGSPSTTCGGVVTIGTGTSYSSVSTATADTFGSTTGGGYGGGGSTPTSGTKVILTGGSIPAHGSCTVTVNVTAKFKGTYTNTLPAGALHTNNGNNAAPAVAVLTVFDTIVPTVSKSFSPTSINAGGTSTLTITLSNQNSTAAALTAAFIDSLPSGLTTSGPATTTCGGMVTVGTGGSHSYASSETSSTTTSGGGSTTPSGSTITLTGGSIPAKGSCTITVKVTSKTKGTYVNKIPAGALQTNKGKNANEASATLIVVNPTVAPTLSKSFTPSSINAGGTSTLIITLSNANTTAATLTAALVDALPSGMTVSGTPTTNCGGTVTVGGGGSGPYGYSSTTSSTTGGGSTTTGGSKVTLTGGSIPANGSCTITVKVTAKTAGTYTNKLAAGALQTNKGSNVKETIATLTIPIANVAPTLSKAFLPTTIKTNAVSTLTLTLKNTNSTAAVLTAALIDSMPSGMVVSGGASTTCGGPVSTGVSTGYAQATTGGSSSTSNSKLTLTSGSIPANGSCTVTVKVTAKAKGAYLNKVAAGALQTNKGNSQSDAAATLNVQASGY